LDDMRDGASSREADEAQDCSPPPFLTAAL
jgi:hypothetical protein